MNNFYHMLQKCLYPKFVILKLGRAYRFELESERIYSLRQAFIYRGKYLSLHYLQYFKF